MLQIDQHAEDWATWLTFGDADDHEGFLRWIEGDYGYDWRDDDDDRYSKRMCSECLHTHDPSRCPH